MSYADRDQRHLWHPFTQMSDWLKDPPLVIERAEGNTLIDTEGNRYFDGVEDIVQYQHGGYLNKFLGDGIFVFFGAPVFLEDHSARAIRSAIDCQEAVQQLNRTLESETGEPSNLRVRIGITTGEVIVGNCGSSQESN